MKALDQEDDRMLASQAQQGDDAAFSELVRRHRSRAYGVALRMTGDPQSAEDAVQEALLQAFVHIGQLAELERFSPWLSRIVRNQTISNKRRAARRPEEQFFSVLMGDAETYNGGASLDNILHRLSLQPRTDSDDPELNFAQREFFASVHRMFHGLSGKERELFEAHVFRHLDPGEIAQLYSVSEASVYKSLSRTRKKLKDERLRAMLRDHFLETQGEGARYPDVQLPIRLPKGFWSTCFTSFALCVHAWEQHTDKKPRSLSDVMGFTGQAFRLCVQAGTIGAAGPSMFFWEPVFAEGVANLGLNFRHIGDGGTAPSAYMLQKAVAFARDEISEGRPVIAWDLFGPEFGLLYGYDDEKQMFAASDSLGSRGLAYEKLGRGKSGGLFVLGLNCIEHESRSLGSLRRAINMVAAHAFDERTFPGFATGLAAYDMWLAAFRERTIDPLGNAYTLRIAQDARWHAVRFLRSRVAELEGERKRLAFDAEGHYYETATLLSRLADLFPFPSGGAPLTRENASQAELWLTEAQQHEEQALEALGRLAYMLTDEEKENENG
ncbi:MAG: polymerase subunit sigma-24 [Paenibacillus sp.]|nr:polymerase subunit sigma-24 [Paenibacillus sp.]